ncbi:PIN domain-containing protein [Cupriavidus basilensis]|uniref:PIN domain-containing protein n=1 Tax=Cupriavidus basilensis TaxID=68895 RepID=UPI00157AAA81|nr:PIN domain-containing protein [Cupriavidus basilensis]NUA32130.1 PIN domain-containing protein [Cupriavidus basilensis]
MTARRAFIDSNVLLYLLSADTAKADRAEAIVQAGGRISVQVLNEITNVARCKLAMPWPEVNAVARLIQSLCPVEPLTVETHDKGRQIAERYGIGVYDAMIVAAALLSGCEILYSEDMQDGLLIEEGLRIRNPFAAGLPLGAA